MSDTVKLTIRCKDAKEKERLHDLIKAAAFYDKKRQPEALIDRLKHLEKVKGR